VEERALRFMKAVKDKGARREDMVCKMRKKMTLMKKTTLALTLPNQC
jgi:hypothetical protein